MGRLFTSELDRMLNPELSRLMDKFYDKVDLIEQIEKDRIPTGIKLNDTFGFNLEETDVKGLIFYKEYDLPLGVMNSIFKEFQEVFEKE